MTDNNLGNALFVSGNDMSELNGVSTNVPLIVQVGPGGVSKEQVDELRAKGYTNIVGFQQELSDDGIATVNQCHLDGLIAGAEGPGQTQAIVDRRSQITVPLAIATNMYSPEVVEKIPNAKVMVEATQSSNPHANPAEMIAKAKAAGAADDQIMVIIYPNDQGIRMPLSQYYAELEAMGIPPDKVATFDINNFSDDDRAAFNQRVAQGTEGSRHLAAVTADTSSPQVASPAPPTTPTSEHYPAAYSGGAGGSDWLSKHPEMVKHLPDGSTVTVTETGAVIKHGPNGNAYREGWVDPASGYDMSTLKPGAHGNPYTHPDLQSAITDSSQKLTPAEIAQEAPAEDVSVNTALSPYEHGQGHLPHEQEPASVATPPSVAPVSTAGPLLPQEHGQGSANPSAYGGGAPVERVEHVADGSTVTVTKTGAVIKQGPDGNAYREGWVDPNKNYDMSTLKSGKDGNPWTDEHKDDKKHSDDRHIESSSSSDAGGDSGSTSSPNNTPAVSLPAAPPAQTHTSPPDMDFIPSVRGGGPFKAI